MPTFHMCTPGGYMLMLHAAGVKIATSLGRAFGTSSGPHQKADLITVAFTALTAQLHHRTSLSLIHASQLQMTRLCWEIKSSIKEQRSAIPKDLQCICLDWEDSFPRGAQPAHV